MMSTLTERGAEELAYYHERARRAACYDVMVTALEALEDSNGLGLDVPEHLDDYREWIVTTGAIRKCNDALTLAREVASVP